MARFRLIFFNKLVRTVSNTTIFFQESGFCLLHYDEHYITEDMPCISLHPDFDIICLNNTVLETAYPIFSFKKYIQKANIFTLSLITNLIFTCLSTTYFYNVEIVYNISTLFVLREVHNVHRNKSFYQLLHLLLCLLILH
jgi:hypothetical protein